MRAEKVFFEFADPVLISLIHSRYIYIVSELEKNWQ